MINPPRSEQSLIINLCNLTKSPGDEVESILDKKTDGKDFLYLVKWANFSESQATWESETNLQGVKWVLDSYNAEVEAKKKRLKKLAKLSEKKVRKEVKRRSYNSLIVISLEKIENRLNPIYEEMIPVKNQKLTADGLKKMMQTEASLSTEVTASSHPKPIEETDTFIIPKKRRRKTDSEINENEGIQKEENRLKKMGIRLVQGNLALDTPGKILGCRKQGESIEYAVLFKKRRGSRVSVIPQICKHEELQAQAPWLLSQYLLHCAEIIKQDDKMAIKRRFIETLIFID